METLVSEPRPKAMISRIRRLEIVLISATLLLALAAGAGAIAQTQNIDRPEAHEIQRVERRVDTLQQAHDALKLDIEVRLARIETYVSSLLWLGGLIGALLFGQLGKNLLDVIAVRRGAHSKE